MRVETGIVDNKAQLLGESNVDWQGYKGKCKGVESEYELSSSEYTTSKSMQSKEIGKTQN